MAAAAKSDTKVTLQRADWILAGFEALTVGGAEAVRVEPVARSLGATKGSFYWHFKDLRALHQAMLEAWEMLAGTDVTAGVRNSDLPAREQLFLLVEKVSVLPEVEAQGKALEPAVRNWGRVDPLAAEVLQRVDRRRLADLADFLGEAGLGEEAAEAGAALFYGTMIGLAALRDTVGTPMRPGLQAVAEGLLGMQG